ncbi:MAG: DNA polymerase/3'-5' exonuclease PolX [Verrucomicrobiae bacterium]|nr:DNA polymerase/3'-5' exonuclease PolX [Verrucomicrobiae bacterium]
MITKDDVATALADIAIFMELKGENPFKTRAYQNAVRIIQTTTGDLSKMVEENRLEELPGIGKSMQEKITELVKTGRSQYLEELKTSFPPHLTELFQIPGLGPKKIKLLYEKLNIDSVDSLEKACLEDRVAHIPTLGKKTQENILARIAQRRTFSEKHRYGDVIALAETLVDSLRKCPAVIRVSMAGSFRRGKEVVKDLDLLASSPRPKEVMDYFVSLPLVVEVVNHGDTKSSVLLEDGLACDLRVVSDKEYPYALHHFTGSKEHNIAMRHRAIERGMKMSEWGLFRISNSESNPVEEEELILCKTEEEIFNQLGLDYIPPELREDLGEIQAAENHAIPQLIEWTEICGTFHCHTTASDGRSSLQEMAEAAQTLGLKYLGIADHSKAAFQANGLSEERLLNQIKEIQQWNKTSEEFKLLAGCEVDILKNGQLDFSDDILEQLDYVVASVHNSFSQDEATMTQRIIQAVENEHVTFIGHLTGRLLLERDGYAVNVKKVIEACVANDTWIELNANPYRLDMDWRWWKLARDLGVKCVINPDAHHTSQLAFLRIGINIARKGWLRKQDVINTLPLKKIKEIL